MYHIQGKSEEEIKETRAAEREVLIIKDELRKQQREKDELDREIRKIKQDISKLEMILKEKLAVVARAVEDIRMTEDELIHKEKKLREMR